MARDWNYYERRIDSGPSGTWKVVVGSIAVLMVTVVGLGIFGTALGFFGEAAQVAREEFGPRELLKKYEWFKDAAAAADAKRASITVYEQRFSDLKTAYGTEKRSAWSREDREQSNLWAAEVAGIVASYNLLAAEYNAQMSKFNHRFTNVGDLPQGAAVPLPREFKPYMESVR